MIPKKKQSVQVGDVNNYYVHKAERLTFEPKDGGKTIVTDTLRLTFKRASDGAIFTHDFRFNVWPDPRKVYEGFSIVAGQDNTEEEKKALKAYEKKIEKFNEFEATLIEDATKRSAANLQKLEKMDDEMPHNKGDRQICFNYFMDICDALDLDPTATEFFDGRMLNPKASFKTNKEGKEVVIYSKDMLDTLEQLPEAYEIKAYVANTQFEGCKPVVLEADYKIIDSLIDYITKNIVGEDKQFKLVVGGEYSFRDGTGPHPSLPPYKTKYIGKIGDGEELSFDSKIHINESNKNRFSKQLKNTNTNSGNQDEDLPF